MAAISLALIGVATASAQTAPTGQPDNAAILKALEAINSRLDRLEKDRKAPPRRTAPSSTASAPTRAEPAGQAVPGWYVNLMPWTEDPNAGMAVSGFPGPHFEFNFDMHTRYTDDHTRYIYYGKSFFHPQEAGNYVFSIVLEPIYGKNPSTISNEVFNCSGELLIAGNRVLSGATNYGLYIGPDKEVYRPQTLYGQMQLEKRAYRTEFKVDCWPLRGKNFPTYDTLLPVWKRNRFKVMVKSPADSSARPMLSQEIYYVGIP